MRRSIRLLQGSLPPSELFIGGKFVRSSGNQLPVLSPRDGEEFTTIANATSDEVTHAVESCQTSLRSGAWKDGDAHYRAEILRKISTKLMEQQEDFAFVESMDCGKPITESRADMEACASFFDFYANVGPEYLAQEELAVPEDGMSAILHKEPAGVIGCITPWNFPLMQAAVKIAPALAAGCAVVLKPSPLASLTCLKFAQLASECGLPDGVLNVLTGGPPNGDSGVILGNHPGIDRLSFTGSGPTGKALLHASAEHLRPTGLELGGKSAMVVLDDADIDSVVDWAMVGIFLCTGQVCSATSRVLVHESIAEEFIEKLKQATLDRIRVGDPMEDTTNYGPVVSIEQLTKINEAIRNAPSGGCEAIVSGEYNLASPLNGGYFVHPHIYRTPTDSYLWNNEVFGPILAIATFKTDDEAIALTNGTEYGLGNAVMGSDPQRLDRFRRELQSGVVWENCSQPLYPSTPFGGMKKSGFGREYGKIGLDEYIAYKTSIVAKKGHSWNWYQG